jgi:dimethylargininase
VVRLSSALVRPPGARFADGLTTAWTRTDAADGGAVDARMPDVAAALAQHARYCDALRSCGLRVTVLPALADFPDSTFIEDTALVTARGAIVTRPGAPSRSGETPSVGAELRRHFAVLAAIDAPGTVDGGDVAEIDGHFLIGISARTNEAGAAQLAAILHAWGYTSGVIDIRRCGALLHLKTGIAYLGDGAVAVSGAFPRHPALDAFDVVHVDATESYAANCVRVNDALLIAAGHPATAAMLRGRGLQLIALDVSEFRKMDGGLSCLSLRW